MAEKPRKNEDGTSQNKPTESSISSTQKAPPETFLSGSKQISELAKWHDDPRRSPLLKITLDQLRTILFIHRFGSPFHAAKQLEGREQSSVASQLDALNKHCMEICGEPVAKKIAGRGEPYVFTATGRMLVSWAASILGELDKGLVKHAQETGSRLVIAATAFTAPLIGHALHDLRDKVKAEIDIRQVRTADWLDVLKKGDVGLALAAVVAPNGKPIVPDGLAFIPAGEPDAAGLLTNLPAKEMPGDSLDETTLLRYRLILPQSGIIRDMLDLVYIRSASKPLACDPSITDVYYGINMLRYGLVDASMIMLRSALEWAIDQGPNPVYRNAPPPVPIRPIRLTGAFENVPVIAGLFARKEDLERLGPLHPLQVFWNIFKEKMVQTSKPEGKP